LRCILNARPARPQTILSVLHTEQVTPHIVRVFVGGDGFSGFTTNEFTDKYIKIYFAKPELGLEPPYDLAALRETLDPADLPVTRTYTVREVNTIERWISIDFVLHGDTGLAGPWAAAAQPGDTIVFGGPGGGFVPDDAASWFLFAGDESALPAIAASLEALKPDAIGTAVLEVDSAADEIELSAPAGVDIRWVYRHAQPSTILASALEGIEWRDGHVQVFAHGEREAMKAVRDVLFTQRGLSRQQVSISGYWAFGRSEDRFQAEKREPIGQILA